MNYNILWKGLFAACVALSFFSCDKDTIYLPEDDSCLGVFGSMGAKYAQQGRPFTMGYQCNLSDYAEDVTVEWKLDEASGFIAGNLKDNVSSMEYLWEDYGEKEVIVRIGYRYGDRRESMSDTLSLSVVPPVLDRFFFFDSQEVILESYPDAEVEDLGMSLSFVSVSSSENEEYSYLLKNNGILTANCVRTLKDLADPYQYMRSLFVEDNPAYQTSPTFSISVSGSPDISEEAWNVIRALAKKMDEGEILIPDEIARINEYYMKSWLVISLEEVFDYGALSYKVHTMLSKQDGKDSLDVSYSL